jgi:hypothetical protein
MNQTLVVFLVVVTLHNPAFANYNYGVGDSVKLEEDSLEVNQNKFDEVKIGSQIWMQKNLDIDTFRNGDSIFASDYFGKYLKKRRLPLITGFLIL